MFCRACGNEINDNAILCPKCGCATERKNEKKLIKEIGNGLNLFFNIANYIDVILICLTLTAFALSIGTAEIYTSASTTKTQYYISAFSTFNPNISALIVSFILSLCSYVFGTTSFILGFFQVNRTKRFTSDVLFIIVNCLLFLLLFCCAVHLF